ncbi:MAG: sigma 54-interacting transcriptional regulator [Myxococcota bacterium]
MSEIGLNQRPIGRRRSDRIVGASRAHQRVVEKASTASRVELPVVISGPAGSGKEHLSRAIHAWSDRAAEAFVIVSCGAINESLIAREIFGCTKGVYPLLADEYAGALTRAAGGTVLIDEFDQLPELPRKSLITALSDGTFQREGDTAPIPMRARVIASAASLSSPSPLGELEVQNIELLSLRERSEDVLPLAAHLLRLAADEAGVKAVGFTSDARDALLAEPWPGNVRELAERIRQAVLLVGDGAISAEALLLAGDPDEVPSFKEAKRAFETRYVVGLLRRCGGNISRAARLAKKDRKDFYDVIRRTGVNPSEFR